MTGPLTGVKQAPITSDDILRLFTVDSIERTPEAQRARGVILAAALQLGEIGRNRGGGILDEEIHELAGVADRAVWVLGTRSP